MRSYEPVRELHAGPSQNQRDQATCAAPPTSLAAHNARPLHWARPRLGGPVPGRSSGPIRGLHLVRRRCRRAHGTTWHANAHTPGLESCLLSGTCKECARRTQGTLVTTHAPGHQKGQPARRLLWTALNNATAGEARRAVENRHSQHTYPSRMLFTEAQCRRKIIPGKRGAVCTTEPQH